MNLLENIYPHKKAMITSDYKSFQYLENGDIQFSQFSTTKSVNVLDKGSYKITYEEYPVSKVILSLDSDFETSKTHEFSDKEKIDILFESFFNKKVVDKIQKLGFCHKVGILLYGMEGTGKSTIIKHYCTRAINEQGAIVFHMLKKNSYITQCWDFIQKIRQIQPNPIIIVFDEFDEQMNLNESFLKTVIDGNNSISNCVFFAATNYLDKIPHAFKDRPSRFKYTLNIEGMQIEEDIEDILRPILSDVLTKEEILKCSHELKGKTLDYIKQFSLDKLMNIKHYGKAKTKIGY